MIFLLLAIITSSSIFILFKFFEQYKINIIQALTFNYLVATLLGAVSAPNTIHPMQVFHQQWIWLALISGVLLIATFFVYAVSTQKVGIAITSVSGKMSVIIPVLFGFLLFNEVATWLRIIGIVLALVAFYLTLMRTLEQKAKNRYLILPVLLFFGNGFNDSIFKVMQQWYVGNNVTEFLTTAFCISLMIGLVLMLIQGLVKKQSLLLRNLIAGTILGVLNWYSTYFFLIGLNRFDVSVFVPVFNVSIVTIGALVGYLFYKEKLSKVNIIGIAIAMISIVLISGIWF
ncbi:MAG: DMT family transporter [Bacteroidota bacterium]